MAQFLGPVVQQLNDASANPYSGAKMHVYITATTTPVALFSDEDLLTPIANPLVADSSGAFPIAFMDEIKCKVIITTSADVTVFTRDPVYNVGRADSLTAADVSFDGTASGLAADDVQEALDEIVTLQGLTQSWTSASDGVIVTATSTNSGAGGGPDIDLYRDSASPAASDVIGGTRHTGENAAGTKTIYTKDHTVILDTTNGSEDGKRVFQTRVAGALADRVHIGAGIWGDGATGGDPGTGKANFTEVQTNGVAMPFSKSFTSAEQTVGSGATQYTLPHSLGAVPKLVTAVLRCKTTNLGWAVGDEITYTNEDSSGISSFSIGADATNVYISHSSAPRICNRTTSAVTAITEASWRWVARAWA